MLRRSLVEDPQVSQKIPAFVRTCRDPGQFWSFIQTKFSTYRERREFIWEQLRPLLDWLENQHDTPSHSLVSEKLHDFDSETVHQECAKALDRLIDDSEGAITSARTLLESVCKHILDQAGEAYDDGEDLPKLYYLTARQLNLAPDQHSGQMLGGCQSIVNGLASVRNRFGDAHGHGAHPVRPSQRHASLAVNIAGAMSAFLVETNEARL